MDVQADPHRSTRTSEPLPLVAWWLAAMLFASLAALCLLGVLEWEHYRRLLKSREVSLSISDRLIVLWLLWLKSVLPLLPVMACAAIVAATSRRRLATLLLAGGATLVFFWLAVDVVMQKITGSHVFDFLPYLYDAWHASDVNHFQWAGDTATIAVRSVAVLLAVAGSAWGLWLASRRLSQWMVHRLGWLNRGWISVAWTLLFLISGLAAIPAQGLFSQPLLLRRLHTAMPVDMALFVPYATSIQLFIRVIGGREQAGVEQGVRIVSVLPDPAGDDDGKEQVTLHNFADQPFSLDGWRLQDASQHRFALSGSIAPQQTITITLPVGTVLLDDAGDELFLIDDRGRRRHRIKYKGDLVKYGGVISFREEYDLDEFLLKTNQGLQSVYSNLRPQILTAQPADETAYFSVDHAPNVIYLVLESFRESAVSPRVMKRLDAWGQRGLRLRRHYAGSNSSHLGLFALLYGRSPLVYYPTVNANVPPQTPLSLRKSGYDLTFVTSGDCTDFRKMDRFLNDTHFDRVIVENGQDWRDWPQRDRKTLEHVGRIAGERSEKPRFIMAFLMSTHFPYAFPPEFDIHQPSAADSITKENWREFDAGVLHNRYRNAALSLERELMELIDSLDPQRNLIVITGDHGESMGEDGALAHASRGSEVQTRVPFLMVGPGIEPRRIEEPTTHSDIPPTLLHLLAGRHVPIEHIHGRDLVSQTPLGEQVMICPYRWKDPYDLILMRGPERMLLKIRLNQGTIESHGFCDPAGNLVLNPPQTYSESDAPIWVEAFRQELLRVVR